MREKEGKVRTGARFSLHKAWEILFPYLIYYLVFNAAYIMVAFACQAGMESFGEGFRQFVTVHADTVSGVAEGLCRMIAILPLVPMLKKELMERLSERRRDKDETGGRLMELTITVILAVCVSLGLNVLLALTGFAETSASYQSVAEHQYGVTFGIGLVLYGVVSPMAEEVVFRGVIFNRLRRIYGPPIGIVASALFFGVFHGNLVQGLYGTVMGLLMAYVYERQGSFFRPVLFHAAANLAVYTVAHWQAAQTVLFTPSGSAVLLAVSAACVFLERNLRKR